MRQRWRKQAQEVDRRAGELSDSEWFQQIGVGAELGSAPEIFRVI